MSGWDPLTGQSVACDDLSDLIKAAGATPSIAPTQDPSNSLCIKLMTGGGAQELETFYTLDVHEAQSRICAFFEAVNSPTMHVKIDFGYLAALAFKDGCGRVQTSWMDRSKPAMMKTNPAMISYPASQFPAWAHKISTCFLNVIHLSERVDHMKSLAKRPIGWQSAPGEVHSTPSTPWLEAQAPSMFHSEMVDEMPSMQGMQGVMYA